MAPPPHSYRARPNQLFRLFLGILLPVLVVGYVAEDVLEKQRFAFERPLLEGLHHLATPALDHWAIALTTVGGLAVMGPATLLLLVWLWWKDRPVTWFVLMALGGAEVLNLVMKLTFTRARPDLWPLLVSEKGASFPSGHSMYSMALAVTLSLLLWRGPYRWPAVVLGSLYSLGVGLSRVYLGVHYPTDVLCGWLAGLAWVLGVYSLMTGRPENPLEGPQT